MFKLSGIATLFALESAFGGMQGVSALTLRQAEQGEIPRIIEDEVDSSNEADEEYLEPIALAQTAKSVRKCFDQLLPNGKEWTDDFGANCEYWREEGIDRQNGGARVFEKQLTGIYPQGVTFDKYCCEASTMKPQQPDFKSTSWNESVKVLFSNESDQEIELFWHNYQGIKVSYGHIGAGQTMNMYTYATHPWSAVGNGHFTVDGKDVYVPVKADDNTIVYIDDKQPEFKSKTSNQPVPITFKNESNNEIELFWLNYQGYKVSYGRIGAGQTRGMNTYATHPWMATGCTPEQCIVDGDDVYVPVAADSGRTIIIGEEVMKSSAWNESIQLDFFNGTGEDVKLYWHDYSGYKQPYGTIRAGETHHQYTYATHPWSVTGGNGIYTVDGESVFQPMKSDDGRTIYIDN